MSDPDPHNPYAAPAAELIVPSFMAGVRTTGKLLVVPKGWISPPVCLFTGATGPLTPLRQARLSYMHPAWLLMLLLSPIVLILVGLIVTRKSNIYYVLSEDCARRHRRRLLGNWAIFFGGMASVFCTAYSDIYWLGPFGLLLIVISAVLAATRCRLIKAAKIEGDSIWLSGIPAASQAIIMRWEEKKFSRKQAELVPGFPGECQPSPVLPL